MSDDEYSLDFGTAIPIATYLSYELGTTAFEQSRQAIKNLASISTADLFNALISPLSNGVPLFGVEYDNNPKKSSKYKSKIDLPALQSTLNNLSQDINKDNNMNFNIPSDTALNNQNFDDFDDNVFDDSLIFDDNAYHDGSIDGDKNIDVSNNINIATSNTSVTNKAVQDQEVVNIADEKQDDILTNDMDNVQSPKGKTNKNTATPTDEYNTQTAIDEYVDNLKETDQQLQNQAQEFKDGITAFNNWVITANEFGDNLNDEDHEYNRRLKENGLRLSAEERQALLNGTPLVDDSPALPQNLDENSTDNFYGSTNYNMVDKLNRELLLPFIADTMDIMKTTILEKSKMGDFKIADYESYIKSVALGQDIANKLYQDDEYKQSKDRINETVDRIENSLGKPIKDGLRDKDLLQQKVDEINEHNNQADLSSPIIPQTQIDDLVQKEVDNEILQHYQDMISDTPPSTDLTSVHNVWEQMGLEDPPAPTPTPALSFDDKDNMAIEYLTNQNALLNNPNDLQLATKNYEILDEFGGGIGFTEHIKQSKNPTIQTLIETNQSLSTDTPIDDDKTNGLISTLQSIVSGLNKPTPALTIKP